MPKHNLDKLKDKKLVTFYLNKIMWQRLQEASEILSRKHTDIIKESIFAWLETNELSNTTNNKEKK